MEAAKRPVFGKCSYDRAAEGLFLDKLPVKKPDLPIVTELPSPDPNKLDVRLSQRDYDEEKKRYALGSEGEEGDDDTVKFKVENMDGEE